MRRIRYAAAVVVIGTLGLGAMGLAQDGYLGKGKQSGREDRSRRYGNNEYLDAIERTANMVNDQEATQLARARGLDLLNLTWEDTGRYKNSSVGPNISDMTIQVAADYKGEGYRVKSMPVIRFPNFSDRSADIDPHNFTLLVGNEKGRGLQRVSLYDFLDHPQDFLHDPRSWPGGDHTLLAERDNSVLASAQACFLPVPKQGKATFNPVLFNYQSSRGNPAVLTILATREGTSVTVIDNTRDAFAEGAVWGQRLFHNQNGMRASLTGQRESDYYRGGSGNIGPGEDPQQQQWRRPERQANLNMVLLIQVPLIQRNERQYSIDESYGVSAPAAVGGMAKRSSNVENAVIGHGKLEGPFTEIDHLNIERDERFPIRVTVQFYKATSNGVVNAQDLDAVRNSIDWVYSHGDAVGSLVTQGNTGRPTEYWGMKVQPPYWWEQFWNRYERNQGMGRDEARRRLARILGQDYMDRPVCELYLRDRLRGAATQD